jgi:hypothetical protein
MGGKKCADCRTLTGSVRKSRCDSCRAAHRAAAERERYAAARDHQAESVGEPTEPEIYGGDGRSRPPTIIATQMDAEREPDRRSAYRQNPRHDAATRAKLDHAEDAAANDQATWGELTGSPQGGHTVDFLPAQEAASPAVDGWGRSHRQRTERAEYVLDNPAALGAAFAPSTAAGDRAVHAQKHAQQGAGRFGPGIDVGQIHAGQLASPPSTMVSAENRAAEQAQAQRQAMAEHARLLLPGR